MSASIELCKDDAGKSSLTPDKKFKIFNEQSWSEQFIGIWLRHEIQDAALLSEAEN